MAKKKNNRSDPTNKSSMTNKNGELEEAEKIKVALVNLDVDLQKLAREPKITAILRHRSLGGLEQVLSAIRLSSDPIFEAFLERYDAMNPAFQRIVPWEAIAQLAGVDVRQLLGSIVLALRDHSVLEVKIAALTAHPNITQATVDTALIPGIDGVRDRMMMHQALGFLAPPKGQTINVNLPGAPDMGDDAPDNSREIPPEDIDMNQVFPDLTATQKLLPD